MSAYLHLSVLTVNEDSDGVELVETPIYAPADADASGDEFVSNLFEVLMYGQEDYTVHYDRAFDGVFDLPLYSMDLNDIKLLDSTELGPVELRERIDKYLANVKDAIEMAAGSDSRARCFALYDLLRVVQQMQLYRHVRLSFS